jgi:hypothetical protein
LIIDSARDRFIYFLALSYATLLAANGPRIPAQSCETALWNVHARGWPKLIVQAYGGGTVREGSFEAEKTR